MKRLILTADDFGRASPVNQAVWDAHHRGLLTSASLMVNGAAFDEAVRMARSMPSLAVGLHLTLVCGHSTLASGQIPGLADCDRQFSNRPVNVGLRYFFQKDLRPQLEAEIAAQFQKFHATGLKLDHVDGHLNLHLHPVVFKILCRHAQEWGIRAMRLTSEPFWLSARMSYGHWGYRISHALIFRCLSRWAGPLMERSGIAHADRVFGLLQSGRVNES
jgi:chitin disaccharide deacetylase